MRLSLLINVARGELRPTRWPAECKAPRSGKEVLDGRKTDGIREPGGPAASSGGDRADGTCGYLSRSAGEKRISDWWPPRKRLSSAKGDA